MSKNAKLLDCTLRDGSLVNSGNFGENTIKNVIISLIEANIDIVEVGFLDTEKHSCDISKFYNIADVKRVLPKDKKNSKISVMALGINLEHIEPNDGTIDLIRIALKRSQIDEGLKTIKMLMDKGYNCCINPVNCNVYSDIEFIELLSKVNKLKPYAFSIVDTFGVMDIRKLSHTYFLVENNLHEDITIGLHLHENLGLSYTLAQHFLNITNPKRKLIIDSSLYGMGRAPGNLKTEQFIEHMNKEYALSYNVEPLYNAIDDYIFPITKDYYWGYSIPYELSARYNLHRTYPEFLMSKNNIKINDIKNILKQVVKEKYELFDEEYIENLYINYINNIK